MQKYNPTSFYTFWNKESFANAGIGWHWEEFKEIIIWEDIAQMF